MKDAVEVTKGNTYVTNKGHRREVYQVTTSNPRLVYFIQNGDRLSRHMTMPAFIRDLMPETQPTASELREQLLKRTSSNKGTQHEET